MRWLLPAENSEGSVLERLLRNRKIAEENWDTFLHPELGQLRSPHLLYDTDTAAEVILGAIKKKQKIFIHGDYDVDGVCTTAILWDLLYRELHADVLPYIPNRFDEGYGLSHQSISAMKAAGAELIITVDCGIRDIDIVEAGTAEGLKFIITDHHTLPTRKKGKKTEMPFVSKEALAVVHPKYPQRAYPFAEICGATVGWKLAQVIAEKVGLDTDMNQYLELVALATVCDVMPLVDENRVIVKYGLERLRQTKRPGLQALLQVAGVSPESLQTYHLGFVVGPRLNASGRLDTAMDALRLLTTTDRRQASKLARKLQALNSRRQAITQSLLAEADARIATLPAEQKLYFVYGPGWSEGVVGLVAGKLREKYNRPVLIGSASHGVIKGSARSIPQLHITELLKQAEEYLIQYGGHAQAAGFMLEEDKVEGLTSFLLQAAADSIRDEDLEPYLKIDLALRHQEVSHELVGALEALNPWGYGNSQPVFALQKLRIADIRSIGKENKHFKIWARGEEDLTLDLVSFGMNELRTGLAIGDFIDAAGNLELNEWNGNKTIQMRVKDIAKR